MFGATTGTAAPASTGFTFGAPAAAPFGQMAPATPAAPAATPFGQPTSVFGASTQPTTFGFGAQPAAQPATAFGMQQSTFGAAQPASPFGVPAPATGGFGMLGQQQQQQQQQQPAQPTTFGFGTQPAAQPTAAFGMQQSTFGAAQPASPFGVPAPATGGFGMLGQQQQQQQPAQQTTFGFGTQPAAQPTAAFGMQQSTFGAAQPASPFGVPAPAPGGFGMLGQQQQQQQQQQPAQQTGFGTGGLFGTQPAAQPTAAFGMQQSTFGAAQPASPFGVPAPAPGGFSMLGQQQQQQPAQQTGFGTGGLFGVANQQKPAFGNPAPVGGGPTSTFSLQTPNPAFPTPSLTGNAGGLGGQITLGQTGFGAGTTAQPAGSHIAKFAATSYEGLLLQSITAMQAYTEKSFEELRYEDSKAPSLGAAGGFNTGFGQQKATLTSGSTAPGQPGQTLAFPSTTPTTNALAGQTSFFGGAGTFGQTGTSAQGSLFPSASTPGGGLFGSSATPQQQQQQQPQQNQPFGLQGFSMQSTPQPAATGFPFGPMNPPAPSIFSIPSTPPPAAPPAVTVPQIITDETPAYTPSRARYQSHRRIYNRAQPTPTKTPGQPDNSTKSFLSTPSKLSFDITTSESRLSFTPSTSKDSSSGTNGATSPNIPKLGLVCTKPHYTTKPSVRELENLYITEGRFFASDFTVIHDQHGSIQFKGVVDIRNLNIDEVVTIHEKEVSVDHSKEEYGGKKLNIPARVTLNKIVNAEKLANPKIQNRLQQWCQSVGATFISLDTSRGMIIFDVEHFSKYAIPDFDDDDDDDQEDLDGIQPIAPIDNLVEAHSGIHPHAATPLRNEMPYYQTSHALPASAFSQPAFMATPETSHAFSFSHGLSVSSKRIDQEEHEADIDHYPDEDEAVEGENDDADLGIDNLAENASSENLFPYFSRSYVSKPLPKWSGGPRQKRGFRVSWMGNAVVSSSNSQVFLRQCTTDNIMNRQGLKSRSFANAVMTGQTQSRYRFSDLIEQGYYDLFPEAAHRNLWTFIRYINNCLAETESSYGRSLDMSLRAAIDDFLTEFLSDIDISELSDVYEKIIYCIALGKLDSALSQANHLDNPYFCLLLSQVTLSQAHMETITNLLVALRDSSSILDFNSKLVSILEVFAGNLSNVLQAFPNLPWRVYMALGFRYCVFRNVNIREGINQFSYLLTTISTANTAHKESQVYLAVLQALLRMPFDILAITQYIPSILPFDKPPTTSIHLSWHILNFLLYTTRIDLDSAPRTREEIARVINESVECLLVEKMYDQAIVVYLAWVDAFQGWTTPIDQCERLFGFQLSSSSRYGLEKLECIQPNIWSNLTTIKLDAISKIYQHKMVDAIENLSQLADEQSRELLHLALHHVLRDQLLFVAPDSNCVESSGFVQVASGLLPPRDNYWNLTYQLGAHEEALGSYARCIGGMLISGDYFEVLSSMKSLHEPLPEEREMQQYTQSQTDARSKRILDKHLAREKILRECVSFHYYCRYYEHNVGDMNENNSKYIDHLLANKRLVSLVAQSQARTTSSLHQPGV